MEKEHRKQLVRIWEAKISCEKEVLSFEEVRQSEILQKQIQTKIKLMEDFVQDLLYMDLIFRE